MSYLQATKIVRTSSDAQRCWRENVSRFSYIAKDAKVIFAIQSSFVVSEGKLSWANNLILEDLHLVRRHFEFSLLLHTQLD